jgi:DNA-binding IclR family transcriptional regulator
MTLHIVKPQAARPAPPAYPGTQAVLRALRLLKAFNAERPERGLADLSQSLGLNKTTTYRLLRALESEGMIERGGNGDAYRLGPEMVTLGNLALGTTDLRAVGRGELLALAQETRETATLEVLVGSDVLILDEIMGSYVIGTIPSLGTRWPAHATSTGKAVLAHLEGGADALGAAPLPSFTPRTLTDPQALARELARVRQRGFAISAEELEPGFVAVGAPVHDALGRVVAAVSVGGPKTRLTTAAVAAVGARVKVAADRISERLGYRPREAPEAPRPKRGPA